MFLVCTSTSSPHASFLLFPEVSGYALQSNCAKTENPLKNTFLLWVALPGGFSLEQLQFLSGEAPRKNAIFSVILGLFSVICGAIISPNGARTGELGAFFTEIEENGILGSLLM